MDVPPNALTITEKAKIRAHLDFPVIDGRVALALGLPVNTQVSTILDDAVERVLPEALPIVRRYLEMCECTEAQLAKAQQNLSVASVTGVTMRPREALEDLEDMYMKWVIKLASSLAVVRNPEALPSGGVLLV